MRDPIDGYLDQLDRELRLKRAPRSRIIAEAADHLRSAAGDLAETGMPNTEAEREAVTRFGAAVVVARWFAQASASTTLRSALAWTTLAFASYAGAAVLFLVAAPSWLHDFPQGVPSGVALQVGGVSLVLSGLRVLRWRSAVALDEQRLHVAANGVLITALALAAAAGAELLVAFTRPAAAPWESVPSLIAAFTVAAGIALPATFAAGASFARASALRTLPREAGGEKLSPAAALLVEDVAAVAPPMAALAAVALRHPARTCALVAACAFAAVVGIEVAGGNVSDHEAIIVGAIATGLFEVCAVIVGYFALGRALGLRPAAPV